jgi:hypothetical protein
MNCLVIYPKEIHSENAFAYFVGIIIEQTRNNQFWIAVKAGIVLEHVKKLAEYL